MTSAIHVTGLNKVYDNGFQALDNIDINVEKGEIFALLGPNGAGKTTLISAICGIAVGTLVVIIGVPVDFRRSKYIADGKPFSEVAAASKNTIIR